MSHLPRCHPERSRTIREANRSAESKDPYSLLAVGLRSGVFATLRGSPDDLQHSETVASSARTLLKFRQSSLWSCGRHFGGRGPSTSRFRSLRERNCCAQDDNLRWFSLSASFIQGNHSRAKSSQCGFSDSISAIFFDRLQPFSCFSRLIASNLVERLPVQETLDLILVRESFDAMEFVLEDALVQVAGHADVESARQAAHDVRAVRSALVRHGRE